MKIEPTDFVGWVLMGMIAVMVIGMLAFVFWAIGQAFAPEPKQNYYQECVMKAVDKYQASADILAICKELK